MRWRLIIEEYGPTLEYVKGKKNVVADALSCLDLSPSLATESNPLITEHPTTRQLAEAFALTNEDFNNKCPLTLKTLMREQQKDKDLIKRARGSSALTLRSFHGGGKIRQLFVEHDKIVVPARLQRPRPSSGLRACRLANAHDVGEIVQNRLVVRLVQQRGAGRGSPY
jgi:hypothetical protein